MIEENWQGEMISIKLVEEKENSYSCTVCVITDAPIEVITKVEDCACSLTDFKSLLVEEGYSVKPFVPQFTINFDD